MIIRWTWSNIADMSDLDTILHINVILSPAESEAALGGGVSAANLVGAGENRVDMLEIPGKGRCYVYLARSVQYSTVQYSTVWTAELRIK